MPKNENDNVPAWIIAQSLVIKAKNALIEEAIDILYKEIEAKRMALEGKFMPMELEKSGEMEQGMFLIRHLMEQKPEMDRYFEAYIKGLQGKNDKKTSELLENAKKFMSAVQEIELLTNYGFIFDKWFEDVSKHVAIPTPEEILAKTSGGKTTHRTLAIRYLVNHRIFKEEDIFNKQEQSIFNNTLKIIDSSV